MRQLILMRGYKMSNMPKHTHILAILDELLEGKPSTSLDSKASNRNQYYKTIKHQGIELVEVWEQNLTNKSKHKVRTLHNTPENIERAKAYKEKILKRISVNTEA